ncbi:MAG: citrate/2-methylcitrate synthase [Candidatus Odinarchaeota archaeon]
MAGKLSQEQISRIVDEIVKQIQQSTDTEIKDTGLRGIKVATSNICLIDGKEGKLFYRGYEINDLARDSTYEEVAYLLLYGELPSAAQLAEFSAILASNYELPREIIEILQKTPKSTSSMKLLQSAIALLANFDPEIMDESKDATRRKAIRIIAKVPTIVAAWERIKNNQAPVSPDRNLSHAGNFLYMLDGKKPAKDITRLFDVDLLLHAEHSFNASTFTARVIASTGADLYAAISGAVGSLAGKLHGGANALVMENLLEVGDEAKVETWVKNQFDSGKRIMGMGHAVYRTTDPRAIIIKGMAERILQENKDVDPKFFNITKKIAEITQKEFKKRKGRDIYPNVDLYGASIYSALGIPTGAFTAIFALSRVAGWTAHVLEHLFPEAPAIKPVLYRPSADYAGKYCGIYGCPFIPLEKRETQLDESSLARKFVVQELQKNQQVYSKSVTQDKKLVTEADISELARENVKELHLTGGTVITPLARDRAREKGIDIFFKG